MRARVWLGTLAAVQETVARQGSRPPGARRAGLAAAAVGLSLLVLPRAAQADVAPTPPYVYAPPTFLFLLFAAYVLLMFGAGLGIGIRRLLKKPAGTISQRKAVITAATVALALTVLLVAIAEMTTRRSRSERRAHQAVKSNLGAIRSTEVAYYAEWNVWVGGQPLTPLADRRGNDEKVPWDPNTRFSILGFAPEGDVVCSYALEGPAWSTEGFAARAECDYDEDGQVAVYRITSADNEIVKSGAPF